MNCRKKKFKKECNVKTALEEIRRSKNPNRHEYRYYMCEICKCFHLSSQDYVEDDLDVEIKHKKKWKKLLKSSL